jgi:hypothetical protein
MPLRTQRSLGAVALLAAALLTTACSGTTGGEEGPVQVSSAMPAGNAPAPGLGSATIGGITVTGASLQKSGPGIGVVAVVNTTRPDRLVSIASNYTQTAVLPQPVPVMPGTPTTIDPTTAVLQKLGTIDDGATVSITFTFATAGPVQVFATYRA